MEKTQDRGSRRDFLAYGLYTSAVALGAAILYPVIRFLKPPKVTGEQVKSVTVGKEEDFAPGSGTIFRFGNKPGILVRTKEGTFRAFTATCTHLDCTVQYKKEAGVIWCACHNGQYDLTGRNIAGPPPRPLDPFEVTVKGGHVVVFKS